MGEMSLEAKKPQAKALAGRKKVDALGWWRGVREEFSRVSWTSRAELKAYTKIVVVATFVVGLGIYAMDLIVQGVLGGLAAIFKAIIG